MLSAITWALLGLLVVVTPFDAHAQRPEWDVVGGMVDQIFGPLGPVASFLNLEELIEERPAVWRGSMAGMTFGGPAYIYLLRWPPEEDMFAGLPIDLDMEELSPLGDSTQVNIVLVDPNLGPTRLTGAFVGPAGERTFQLHLDGDGADSADEAVFRLTTAPSSLIEEHTFRSTQGQMVVSDVDCGFRATITALMETLTPSWQDPPVSVAPFDAQICEVAGDQSGEFSCGLLEIVEHWPERRRENVDFKDPGIKVEFSDPVRFASVGDHFEVFTMGSDGEKISVPGEMVREDDHTLSFVPEAPLEPGVIYEARVLGGPGGLKSQFDAHLHEDYRWRFSTMFELNEENIDLHVYQTSRDAPLVADKPTLTRVYVNWEEYEHIDADWQPTSFEAAVRIYDSADGELYTEYEQPVRIHRPDQYNELDERHARHTVNLFGWKPNQRGGSTLIEAEIEPHEVYPEPTIPYRYYGERQVERWPYDPPRLVFDYFLLPIGPWSEGIPSEALANARSMARSTAIYTTQTFPVVSTHGRYVGAANINFGDRVPDNLFSAEGAAELLLDATGIGRTKRYLRRIMQRIHDQYGPRTNADVIVGLFPLEFYGSGQSFTDIDVNWDTIDEVPDFFFRTVMLPVWDGGPNSSALTHEFGHAFGLHHEPPSSSEEERLAAVAAYEADRYPGIEGFRIAPSGTHGWNKSTEEGNAEHSMTLVSFMFPESRSQETAFTTDSHYRSLLSTFRAQSIAQRSEWRPTQAAQVAALGPLSVAALPTDVLSDESAEAEAASWASQQAEFMMVAGFVRTHDEGGDEAEIEADFEAEFEAEIEAVRRGIPRARDLPEGPYTAVLIDDDGRTLAAEPFGPPPLPPVPGDGDPDGWEYFQVYLPDDPMGRRIELRRGNNVLAVRTAEAMEPDVLFVTPEPGAHPEGPFLVEWQGNSDSLSYTLMYSPNGRFPWRLLAADVKTTTFQVHPERLRPGANPTLRVIANDGFEEAVDELGFRFSREPIPVVTWPTEGEEVPRMLDVEALFDTDVEPTSLRGRFQLYDLAGEEVPVSILYDEATQAALLTPQSPLEAERTYTAILRAGVVDRYGQRLANDVSWSFVTAEASPLRELPHFFDEMLAGVPAQRSVSELTDDGDRTAGVEESEPESAFEAALRSTLQSMQKPSPQSSAQPESEATRAESPDAPMDTPANTPTDARTDTSTDTPLDGEGTLSIGDRSIRFAVDRCALEQSGMDPLEMFGSGVDERTGDTLQISVSQSGGEMGVGRVDTVVVDMAGGADVLTASHMMVGTWISATGEQVDGPLVTFGASGTVRGGGKIRSTVQGDEQVFSFTASCP